MASVEEGEEVRGVIFQFSAEAVLFEFSLDGQADQVQIGMVKPSGLRVGNRNIPASVKKMETLEKYIEVGDELECRVVKEEGMGTVSYQEEDEGGSMVEVEIQPDWRASKAVKVQAEDKRVKAKEMENPFYNEEEVEEEEESVKDALPDPVSVTKTAAENQKDDDEKGGEVGGAPGTDMPDENGRDHGNEVEDVGVKDTEDCEDDVEKSSENGDDGGDNDEDTEEDLLELEVNPDEFEDLGVNAANSSQDKETSVEEEEEEIEIIEHVVNLRETEENGPPGEDSAPPGAKSNIGPPGEQINIAPPGEELVGSGGDDPVCPPGEESVLLPAPVRVKNGEEAKSDKSQTAMVAATTEKEKEEDIDERRESVKAKLVQYKKVPRQKGKVSSGILEIVEGEFSGQRVSFPASCLFAWGHHLVNANLMYHLRLGEPMLVALLPKSNTLTARKVWMGTNKAEAGKDNLEYRAWLMERGLDEETFLQWVSDKLPPKPFFPLKAEQFEAKVIMLIRENPKGDGALVRITTEGDMKDDLVVFERDDFYLCGVHVGEADMRFLLRPGDTVHVNPIELSERERKARVKKFPKLSEFDFRHGSLLAYLGDSRPRGPNVQPEASVELREFLDVKGMTVKEFASMRGGQDEVQDAVDESDSKETTPVPDASSGQASMPFPPPQFPPGPFPWAMGMPPPMGMVPPMVPPGPMMMPMPMPVSQATSTAPPSQNQQAYSEEILGSMQRQLGITEARFPGWSQDPKIKQQVAIAKAKAAAFEIEKKNRIQAAANQAMASGGAIKSVISKSNTLPNLQNPVPVQKPMSDAMQAAMAGTIAALPSAINKDTLATYEKQSRVELQAESGANTKGLQAMSDMKKRLEAFRESKKKKSKAKRSDSPEIIEVNNSGQAWAAKGKEHQEEKEMEPLVLLRKYATLGKKVVERGTNLDFNGIFHPKSVRTPLKSGKVGEVAEFYTLGVLSYFITNLNMDHPEYVRKCINAKVKAVRGPDRVNIQDYLTGQKNYVINLENLSHRELNPEMFGGEAFAPERLRKGSEVRSITGEVVAVGRTEAELKLDRWREKNLPGATAEEQLSSSSRSRTRSPVRGRRSRSRSQSRRKRSLSRSPSRRKRSRTRSPTDYQRSQTLSDPRSRIPPPPPSLSQAGAKRSRFDQGPLNTDQPNENQRWNGQVGQREPRFDQQGGRSNPMGGFDQRPGNGFDQRGSGSAFDQRGPSGFDQREDVAFGQRVNTGFDQRHNGGFDQRSSSGFKQQDGGFDQRQGSGMGFEQQRQNRGFDQRSGGGDSFDQRQGSAFDQRTSNDIMGFDQRSGTFGQQHNSGGFDQRNPTMASFGRGPSGDSRGEYGGGDCYEEDFEYDSGRRNSVDNGASQQGQFQGQGPGTSRFSPWVGDPNNQEGNPAFVIGGGGGAGGRRLGAMFGKQQP